MEKKRILIADDEEAVRLLLVEALKANEYEIDLAENGLEAIGKIDRKPYDLVISDYMMPEMDGLELVRRIRATYPSTPVLVVTGHGPVNELLKIGATACLQKPFDVSELRNKVKTILEQGKIGARMESQQGSISAKDL